MEDKMPHDSLYAKPLEAIVDFKFDEAVVQVFGDMIRRSVPGYSTTIAMLGMLAARYAQAGSRCYDLGCSLGAATLAMHKEIKDKNCSIIAVDSSEAMITRCQANVAEHTEPGASIDVRCEDVRETAIADASVVVLNFTLQFIPVDERQALLDKIYEALLPGGVLILSEKLVFEDEVLNDALTLLHHDFKRLHGYSDLEISQKRAAIEKVLIPETLAQHQTRLKNAGFSRAGVWFQCFNFASLLAIK